MKIFVAVIVFIMCCVSLAMSTPSFPPIAIQVNAWISMTLRGLVENCTGAKPMYTRANSLAQYILDSQGKFVKLHQWSNGTSPNDRPSNNGSCPVMTANSTRIFSLAKSAITTFRTPLTRAIQVVARGLRLRMIRSKTTGFSVACMRIIRRTIASNSQRHLRAECSNRTRPWAWTLGTTEMVKAQSGQSLQRRIWGRFLPPRGSFQRFVVTVWSRIVECAGATA